MKYLFLSSIVWNHYRGRNNELPLGIASLNNECIYLNPLRYKGWKNTPRLQDISFNSCGSVNVISRFSKVNKSFFFLFIENYWNLKYIKENKPDAVISFDHLMSIFSCLYCRYKKIPFVFDVMDDWERTEKNILSRFYYKYIAKLLLGKLSFAVTSTSRIQANVFKKYSPYVYHFTNGKFKYFIDRCEEILCKHDEKKMVVNFVSSLKDWYDFNLLFEVFAEFPDLELNIYGSGYLEESLLILYSAKWSLTYWSSSTRLGAGAVRVVKTI